MPEPETLTEEQVTAIANAGAGPLADLARQAKAEFALDKDEARNYGAGFVSDLLRMAEEPPLPSYAAAIENISNASPATIKVSADDFPNFPVGMIVTFADTGFDALDNAITPITVVSVNEVGKTFKVSMDLSAEEAPGDHGTVTAHPQQVREEAAEPAKTILTEPPQGPVQGELFIPNGYEQAYADIAATLKTVAPKE